MHMMEANGGAASIKEQHNCDHPKSKRDAQANSVGLAAETRANNVIRNMYAAETTLGMRACACRTIRGAKPVNERTKIVISQTKWKIHN